MNEKKRMLRDLARRRGYRPEQVKEAELQNKLKKFRRLKKRMLVKPQLVRRGKAQREDARRRKLFFSDTGAFFDLYWKTAYGQT